MIRGLDTTVKVIRHEVFTEVAKLGFNCNAATLCSDIEAIPYKYPVHLTEGVEASNISEKYYEPPLMQVIPSGFLLPFLGNACKEIFPRSCR